MKDEIKEILIKDFNEILVKEFCTDWKEKRLYIELLVNSTPFSNLLDYITNLQEENDKFDETMKDIKDNLIARINRQECEIHNLKAKLEMYENGVYFSSENDELQQRIDRAIAYIECGKTFDDIETARIIDKYEKILLEILQGSDKE